MRIFQVSGYAGTQELAVSASVWPFFMDQVPATAPNINRFLSLRIQRECQASKHNLGQTCSIFLVGTAETERTTEGDQLRRYVSLSTTWNQNDLLGRRRTHGYLSARHSSMGLSSLFFSPPYVG